MRSERKKLHQKNLASAKQLFLSFFTRYSKFFHLRLFQEPYFLRSHKTFCKSINKVVVEHLKKLKVRFNNLKFFALSYVY